MIMLSEANRNLIKRVRDDMRLFYLPKYSMSGQHTIQIKTRHFCSRYAHESYDL